MKVRAVRVGSRFKGAIMNQAELIAAVAERAGLTKADDGSVHYWNCGRNAHYCAPPAQIRTCGIPAYGSHLGCLTAKRCCGQG
jgi:hypothetical protein